MISSLKRAKEKLEHIPREKNQNKKKLFLRKSYMLSL